MRKLMLSVMVSGALMAGATTASAADACQDGEVKIKFSHVTNTDKHPKGIAASLLEKRVNEEMNGKACIEVFPNSTLFGDSKELEALLLGDVQLLAPSLSKFGSYTDKYGVFDLPFIFKDMDHAIRFTKTPEGKKLLIIMYDVSKTKKKFEEINTLVANCEKNGIEPWVLTASSAKQIEELRHEVQLAAPYYYADGTVLKTMIRSNPGLMFLDNGTVKGKWHVNATPKIETLKELF